MLSVSISVCVSVCKDKTMFNAHPVYDILNLSQVAEYDISVGG